MVGRPYIPASITVHLGSPDSDAENVTLNFADYIKNVASSEIYPTWPENAIRANVYAQISYALNRIYTEWYRSRGYDFDITNSTAFDQSFVKNRDIFESVSLVVDEIFNDYIKRQGNIEPLFAAFCDGREVMCDGLSQWGSVELANQGYTPYDILTYYYGDDIELVRDAPIQNITESYPGEPLRVGSSGLDVRTIQTQLNRISRDYPSIPKISVTDGVFSEETEDAVRAFQEIFNLTPDGIIGKATWYRIKYIFVAVTNLAELDSEGIRLADIPKQFVSDIRLGDSGNPVRVLQYYLSFIAAYNSSVSAPTIDGVFGQGTLASVREFQAAYGLSQSGVVDEATWDRLSDVYLGIIESNPPEFQVNEPVPYPGNPLTFGTSSEAVRLVQERLSFIADFYSNVEKVEPTGYFGEQTVNAVNSFLRDMGMPETGFVGPGAWKLIEDTYFNLMNGSMKTEGQNPGYTLN
ncbi:MAG: peptidoglycan-binding protein [Clostridia bacterium]|nr:peptidoglycan-binding protein [Clostridia bacterium]